jgi:hypothetical protein
LGLVRRYRNFEFTKTGLLKFHSFSHGMFLNCWMIVELNCIFQSRIIFCPSCVSKQVKSFVHNFLLVAWVLARLDCTSFQLLFAFRYDCPVHNCHGYTLGGLEPKWCGLAGVGGCTTWSGIQY